MLQKNYFLKLNKITRQFLFFIIIFLFLNSFFLLFAQNVQSAKVTLAWDYPPVKNLYRFHLYYSLDSQNYKDKDFVIVNEKTYTFENLSPSTWHFVVTAVDNEGNESNFSNEVVFTPDTD